MRPAAPPGRDPSHGTAGLSIERIVVVRTGTAIALTILLLVIVGAAAVQLLLAGR